MKESTLVTLLVAGMAMALALGIWIGLGYPGLYDKYELTGRASRRSPFDMLVDRVVSAFGGKRRRPPPAGGQRKFLKGRRPPRGGGR